MNPNDWTNAFLIDATHVYATTDGGATALNWSDITGNLLALGVREVTSVSFVPGSGTSPGAVLLGSDAGIFASTTDSLGIWRPFGTTLPATYAYDVKYDVPSDTLVVGTLGRGAWLLHNAQIAVAAGSHLYGSAPDDQSFTVSVPLTVSGSSPFDVTVAGGAGKFTLTVTDSVGVTYTTGALTWGATASGVQSALEQLGNVGTGHVTVTPGSAGVTYHIVFSGVTISTVSGKLSATGIVTRTSMRAFDPTGVVEGGGTPRGFVLALQAALNDAIGSLVLGGGVSATVALTGDGKITFTPTGTAMELAFTPAAKASAAPSAFSLDTPTVKYTYDTARPTTSLDRRLTINTRWIDGAFQELGLTASPTPFDYQQLPSPYVKGHTDPIDFTMHVNDVEVPVFIPSQSNMTDINALIVLVQSAVDTALGVAFAGGTIPVVIVCRVNPDVAQTDAAYCQGQGNRVVLKGGTGVTNLSLDVPYNATGGGGGDSPNGAITELGLAQGVGEAHHPHTSTFFLENVSLTGRFEVVVSVASISAHFAFLSVTATGSGNQPGFEHAEGVDDDRLLNLKLALLLKNPTVQPNSISLQIQVSTPTGGGGGSNEVQTLTVTPGVAFTLLFEGKRTKEISGDATAATIQAALESIAALSGNVAVTPGAVTNTFRIEFVNGKADTNVAELVGETVDENRIDIGLIGHAIGHGKLFYRASDAGGGPSYGDNPLTGFLLGQFGGKFGFNAQIAPDGALAGLADDLNAQLAVSAASNDWLHDPVSGLCSGTDPPDKLGCLHFDFQGPDFDSLLQRFQNLDFAQILQAIRFVLDYIRSIDAPGEGLAQVLDAKLPLIDRSISDLVDLVGELADKIDQIAQNPAGAIQQLSNVLAAALGKTVPTTAASTFQNGSGAQHEKQDILISNAVAGTYRLTFGTLKTTPLAWNASTTDIAAALGALKDFPRISVTAISGGFRVEFLQNKDIAQQLGIDGSMLVSNDSKDLLKLDPATGVLTFALDLPFSVSLSRPFSLDLAQIRASSSCGWASTSRRRSSRARRRKATMRLQRTRSSRSSSRRLQAPTRSGSTRTRTARRTQTRSRLRSRPARTITLRSSPR